jgi:hypothetical protein
LKRKRSLKEFDDKIVRDSIGIFCVGREIMVRRNERDSEEFDRGIWWKRWLKFKDVEWCVDYGYVVVFGFLFEVKC